MPARVGHGPFMWRWPWIVWKQLFYDPRPDLISAKTRPPQWKKLQSQWRFFQALFCYLGPPSHVLWNIKWPWAVIMLVATWVNWWQDHATDHDMPIEWDRHGVLKETFKLTSFAMSLLLAFRVNRTFDRWREARGSLSGVGNGATSLFLQAATWIEDQDLVEDFRRYCIIWPFAIKQTVTSAEELDARAAALLNDSELAIFRGSRKGRQVLVTMIRQLVFEANLPTEKFLAMETVIQTTWKSAGDALRIKFQAMPNGISLMCTGFVQIWCLLLPFGLVVDTGHDDWIALVAVAVSSLLLLGCDEVANQMEEPFKMIPIEDIVDTYERDINRVQQELQDLRKTRVKLGQLRKLQKESLHGRESADSSTTFTVMTPGHSATLLDHHKTADLLGTIV